MDQNHLNNYGRGQRKNHLCKIILELDKGFRRSCYLSQLLTEDDDDGQRPVTKAHLVAT